MPTPLTFGVEFEINVAALPDGVPDPDPMDGRPVHGICGSKPWPLSDDFCLDFNFDDPEQRRFFDLKFEAKDALLVRISKTLREVGLPSDNNVTRMDVRASLDALNDEFAGNEGEFTDIGDEFLAQWVVDTDVSIHPPTNPGPRGPIPDETYRYWPIEVKSPIYYFCPQALEAVRLAITTLTKNFRINVNDSCGLHVHVGNKTEGFKFSTIQNLEAFLWIFEPQLNSLHPPERQNNIFAYSARTESELAFQNRILINDAAGSTSGLQLYNTSAQTRSNAVQKPIYIMQPLTASLNTIWETSDINSLQTIMSRFRGKMAYNIKNLRKPFQEKIKRTIEFRQHEGTLDADRVIAWIEVVVDLLIFARDVDIFDLTQMLVESAIEQDENGKSEITVVQLLRNIGLGSPADFYERQMVDPSAPKSVTTRGKESALNGNASPSVDKGKGKEKFSESHPEIQSTLSSARFSDPLNHFLDDNISSPFDERRFTQTPYLGWAITPNGSITHNTSPHNDPTVLFAMVPDLQPSAFPNYPSPGTKTPLPKWFDTPLSTKIPPKDPSPPSSSAPASPTLSPRSKVIRAMHRQRALSDVINPPATEEIRIALEDLRIRRNASYEKGAIEEAQRESARRYGPRQVKIMEMRRKAGFPENYVLFKPEKEEPEWTKIKYQERKVGPVIESEFSPKGTTMR